MITTLLIVAILVLWLIRPQPAVIAWLLALLALLPASDAAMALLNCGATTRFDAISLPGLELAGGVPPSLRAMVAIPVLLTSRDDIAKQIEHLEVHFLANRDSEIAFALLSDWTDSDVASVPGDADLLTMRAVRALQSADVILFDDLVAPAVLDLARREAQRINVGKRGHGPSVGQADISALLVTLGGILSSLFEQAERRADEERRRRRSR